MGRPLRVIQTILPYHLVCPSTHFRLLRAVSLVERQDQQSVFPIGPMVSEQLENAVSHLTIPNLGIIIPNMGTIDKKTFGLGEALFSKTQRQVLGLLFGNPDRSFYANEIVRRAGIGIGTVQRELEKLSKAAILTTEKIGNQKHYQANRSSPIFEELRGLVIKTFGLSDVIRESLQTLAKDIDAAFIFGSVAKGTDHANSDIDIVIVSDGLNYSDIMTVIAEVESRLGRQISPTVYKNRELKSRIDTDNSFVERVLQQPKIFLIGTENDIHKP